MTFTPAHVARVRGPLSSALVGASELIEIRKLYLEKRYKQCIVTCEQKLGSEHHPVHKVFLLFQQAVSYEALGNSAHNYSRNKVTFLESAEEKFRESLDALPQPFAQDASSQYKTAKSSPPVTTLTESKPSINESSTLNTPTPIINLPVNSDFSDSDSECSLLSASNYSIAYSAPDFGRYSARYDLLAAPRGIPRTVTFPDVDKQDEGDSSAEEDETTDSQDGNTEQDSKRISRLSASLSSTHVIADDLVPSPLFSRLKKTATIPFPTLDISEDEPSPPKPRPLLPAPYANGTDHTLVPIRRTAIQTLISRFENTLPSPTTTLSPNTPYSIYTDISLPPSSALTTPFSPTTPITPRFNLIHTIFAPDPHNTHLSAYLSSRSLARYHTALASFRTSLLAAIERTTNAITSARTIQELHAEEKRLTFLASSKDAGKRMASYWLLSRPTPAPRTQSARMSTIDAGNGSGLHDKSGDLRPKTWGGKGQGDRQLQQGNAGGDDDVAARKKKERIEKLRTCGFRVRKENWGWKGTEYYEELRHGAERDLIISV